MGQQLFAQRSEAARDGSGHGYPVFELRGLARNEDLGRDREPLIKGFTHNMKAWWHLPLSAQPRNWNGRRRRQLNNVLADTDAFVQGLNDGYATPAGTTRSK